MTKLTSNIKNSILVLAILLVITSISLFSFFSSTDGKIEKQEVSTKQFRNIVVNNIGFKIPIKFYHPLAIPLDNSSDVNFLLKVELPDIVPLQMDYNNYLGKGKNIQFKPTNILVHSPKNPNGTSIKNLAERLEYYIKFSQASTKAKSIHGLNFLVRSGKKKRGSFENLYEGNRDNPDTVLFCGIEEEESFAGCGMEFYYKDLFIKVSFRRKDWLPQWKEIKQNTINRLEEFHQAYIIDMQASK